MDTFLGRTSTFWAGVEAIAVCVYTIAVIVSLWLIYRQVRIGVSTFQLEAIGRLQRLVDDFRDDRRVLFSKSPVSLALSSDQFPRRPPGRHRIHRMSEGEVRRGAVTKEQAWALQGLDPAQRECTKRVIAKLNDIGQLIEDGFVDRNVFLGKYHVMVIQCCHMVEAARRDEEARRGGNYGQRLLRMRHWATRYNDVWPKHRDVAIEVTCADGKRVIYQSAPATVPRRMAWFVLRQFI